MWDLLLWCTDSPVVEPGLQSAQASLAAANGLSYSGARGILVPQPGVKPVTLHCKGDSYTREVPQLLLSSNTITTVCVFSRSVMSDSWQHHGLQPARLLCAQNSPGKNTGVDCHFLLQTTTTTLPLMIVTSLLIITTLSHLNIVFEHSTIVVFNYRENSRKLCFRNLPFGHRKLNSNRC